MRPYGSNSDSAAIRQYLKSNERLKAETGRVTCTRRLVDYARPSSADVLLDADNGFLACVGPWLDSRFVTRTSWR